MRIDVVTIFPAYLDPLSLSLVGKAVEAGVIDLRIHDLRDAAHDRHRTVDDTPYGGGPGMVMSPEPWGETLDGIRLDGGADAPVLIVPTPSGDRFDQSLAGDWSAAGWLVFACSFPAVLPFLVIDDPRLALRVSNAILLGLLFFVGWRAARHTLARPWIAGIVFLLVGVLLVAVAIPLGG